jgi:uncharacterized cupin superfamily protein
MNTTLLAAPRLLRTAQSIDINHAKLEDWPLDPATVLSGVPQAQGLTLSRSADRRAVRGIWACTPGVFRWVWTYDETLVVTAGHAIVELADGQVELKVGDLAFFERGQASVWRILAPLRKGFHAAASEPLPF